MKNRNFNKSKSKSKNKNNKKKIDLEKVDEDVEIKEGRVIEALPAALFRVKFNNEEKDLICFLKGKIKVFKIKILVGDKVLVDIDPYGGKGRIIRRL